MFLIPPLFYENKFVTDFNDKETFNFFIENKLISSN